MSLYCWEATNAEGEWVLMVAHLGGVAFALATNDEQLAIEAQDAACSGPLGALGAPLRLVRYEQAEVLREFPLSDRGPS